jgi:hypothetical protein
MEIEEGNKHLDVNSYIYLKYFNAKQVYQGIKNLLVRDRRFVGSDLTFSNPVKTDGPVETVQLRT